MKPEYSIYLLKTQSGKPFYVGVTVNIRQRMSAHRFNHGKRITYIILEKCYDAHLVRERFWIKEYISMGVKLKNRNMGRPRVKDRKVGYAFMVRASVKASALEKVDKAFLDEIFRKDLLKVSKKRSSSKILK